MTKEEKIKEAWGGFYNPHIEENGWMQDEYLQYVHSLILDHVLEDFEESESGKIRPKSLQGIENNNGWIKIESEEDLPKEDGDYWGANENGVFEGIAFPLSRIIAKWRNETLTHYQPIVEPKPPIY